MGELPSGTLLAIDEELNPDDEPRTIIFDAPRPERDSIPVTETPPKTDEPNSDEGSRSALDWVRART